MNPFEAFADLFPSRTEFVSAMRILERYGTVEASGSVDSGKRTIQSRQLDPRLKRAGFVGATTIDSDWTYNTTAPVLHWRVQQDLFVVEQWNGPVLDRFTFCRGLAGAKKALLLTKRATIILRKPDYVTRLKRALSPRVAFRSRVK